MKSEVVKQISVSKSEFLTKRSELRSKLNDQDCLPSIINSNRLMFPKRPTTAMAPKPNKTLSILGFPDEEQK